MYRYLESQKSYYITKKTNFKPEGRRANQAASHNIGNTPFPLSNIKRLLCIEQNQSTSINLERLQLQSTFSTAINEH